MGGDAIFRLAYANIIHRKSYSLTTMVISAITVFILLLLINIYLMIGDGLELSNARVGADVILIASNGEFKDEEFLYSVKPTTRYFRMKKVDFLDDDDAVEDYTHQFYINIKDNDGETGWRIVGIDLKSDFLLKPWLSDSEISSMQDDEFIAGADAQYGSSINVLGKTFRHRATLERTGTGMDKTIYINMEVARDYARQHTPAYFFKGGNPKLFYTATFVKLKSGRGSQRFADRINATVRGLKAISKVDSVSSIGNSLSGFVTVIGFLVFLLVLNSFLALFGRYTSLMRDRKKEVGYLRSLGFSKERVYLSFIFEIMIVGVVSGLLASFCVLLSISPILDILSNEFMFPRVRLDWLLVVEIILLGPALSFLLGIISSSVPAFKTAHMEPREAMARGEI